MTEVHRTKTGKPLGNGQLNQMAREAAAGYSRPLAARLRERAESYAADAQTFRDQRPLGGDEDEYWARIYMIVAQELRSCARQGDDFRTDPLTRPGDRVLHHLGPDAVLVIDKSHCIVICTPERRITVGDVARWSGQLEAARTEVAILEGGELGTGD